MKKIISREDKIGETLKKFPQAVDVFLNFGMFCIGCPASDYETIEQGAIAHGKDKEEVTKLIEALNNLLKK